MGLKYKWKAPRKSILKQHISVPTIEDETNTFEQPLSDATSALRGGRQSEGGRRVSFAANAQVRLFDKLQASPSPAKRSTPNRASFGSDEDPNISPLKRRGMPLPRRRSSLLSQNTIESNKNLEKPLTPLVFLPDEDDNSDMDIADESEGGDAEPMSPRTHNSDMSLAGDGVTKLLEPHPSNVADGVGSTSPGRLEAPRISTGSDMSIAPASREVSPETRRLLTDADQSDMSIALTTADVPSHRQSMVSDMDVTNMNGLGSPVMELPAHEFVVPLGRSIPRTDRDGNVVSPTPAEKAKAAALASLQQLSAANGDKPGEGEEDEEGAEDPVVPIRESSEMSIEDAARRLRAASQDLQINEDDQTGTTSSDDMSLVTKDATVNITTMRRPSTLPEPQRGAIPPANQPATANRLSVIPMPSAKIPAPPRIPSKDVSSTSPVKSRPIFTAAFAPPSVSPRKRALSAPSPSPSPAKRRALTPPKGSPLKRGRAQSANPFQLSPSKTREATNTRIPKKSLAFTASLTRNPFLEEVPPPNSSSITPSVVNGGHIPREDAAENSRLETDLAIPARPSTASSGHPISMRSSGSSITPVPPRQPFPRRLSNTVRRTSVVGASRNPFTPLAPPAAAAAADEASKVNASSAKISVVQPSGSNVHIPVPSEPGLPSPESLPASEQSGDADPAPIRVFTSRLTTPPHDRSPSTGEAPPEIRPPKSVASPLRLQSPVSTHAASEDGGAGPRDDPTRTASDLPGTFIGQQTETIISAEPVSRLVNISSAYSDEFPYGLAHQAWHHSIKEQEIPHSNPPHEPLTPSELRG